MSKSPQLSEKIVSEWSKSIEYANEVAYNTFNEKKELYTFLEEIIKDVFLKHLNRKVNVFFKQLGALVEVHVPVQINESVKVTPELLKDLIMPVCVRYSNDRMLVFELYSEVALETDSKESADIAIKESAKGKIEEGISAEEEVGVTT